MRGRSQGGLRDGGGSVDPPTLQVTNQLAGHAGSTGGVGQCRDAASGTRTWPPGQTAAMAPITTAANGVPAEACARAPAPITRRATTTRYPWRAGDTAAITIGTTAWIAICRARRSTQESWSAAAAGRRRGRVDSRLSRGAMWPLSHDRRRAAGVRRSREEASIYVIQGKW